MTAFNCVYYTFNVISDCLHSIFLKIAKNGKGFIDVDWFSGARLNFAENMLRIRDDTIALVCTGKIYHAFKYLNQHSSYSKYV